VTLPAVVVLAEKDLPTWPWCAQGILGSLRVSRLVVIAPTALAGRISSPSVEFVSEDDVVPKLRGGSFPEHRWGWYYQQILKLGIAAHVAERHYVVVDSDLVFLRPVDLFDGNGFPLYSFTEGLHEPYFRTFADLMGFNAAPEYSFISHHMVFNTDLVREMTHRLATSREWWWRIADLRGPDPVTGSEARFSEYETYGHYLRACHPNSFRLRRLRIGTEARPPSVRLLRGLARAFDAVGFHTHSRTMPQKWRLRA
jgi:hypothetical protein